METVTIDGEHHVVLVELAAERLGTNAVVVEDGEVVLQHGGTIGAVLAQAWRVRRSLPTYVMASYMRAILAACEARGVEAPTFTGVLEQLQRVSYQRRKFADVDFDDLTRSLHASVPGMLERTSASSSTRRLCDMP